MTESDPSPPFKKILVANRGEIAVRIIQAAHQLGAAAVSVYSDPDAASLPVLISDEAYRIGPGPAPESYLNIEAIVKAAQESGADAVHPGYGFLAENADFAQAVLDANIVFIGPSPSVIRLMGDKVAAKRIMAEHDIPLIPGYTGDDQTDARLLQEAERIGYPVMLKAAAGGGGRGMREVEHAEHLQAAIEGARREAVAAFGDGRLFLEKLLVRPRHIEVQILGDSHGNLIHLFERDCSIQRRHQKVIEEAPSPALNDEQRSALCEAGLRVGRAADYVNAGTVEFLWSDGQFYFLEMNTRIQVEHPVTEMVTGRDLVQAQIQIAAGRQLVWKQSDIGLKGHAIEARLYAEDPSNGFVPQSGRITQFPIPDDGAGQPERSIRVDTATQSGSVISRFYDPMIAKLVAHNSNREEAVSSMASILANVHVEGVPTNLAFLRWIMESAPFRSGQATTAFLDEEWTGTAEVPVPPDVILLGAAGAYLLAGERQARAGLSSTDQRGALPRYPSSWHVVSGWRVGGVDMRLALNVGGYPCEIRAQRKPGNEWVLTIGERSFEKVQFTLTGQDLIVRVGNELHRLEITSDGSFVNVAMGDRTGKVSPTIYRVTNEVTSPTGGGGAGGPSHGKNTAGTLTAPMPGTILSLKVSDGDKVKAHQPLLVLEAMKMEHVIEAPHAGTVKRLRHQAGDLVTGGETLVEVESD